MTAYADRLIDDLSETDYLPHIKTSQINYVGRSYGVEVDFQIQQLMPKLKLQYFGHLMRRADSLEKILMLGKIEGRRREQQRMR